jgi:hypothetical protein
MSRNCHTPGLQQEMLNILLQVYLLFLVGVVGLNNIKENDYLNVVLQVGCCLLTHQFPK